MNESTLTPLLSLAVIPNTAGDRRKLARGLASLMREDPALVVRTDAASGEVRIFAAGEQHLEIVVDRLRREFDVAATVGRPQVAFKETATRVAEGEMKYARQAGGRGEYGHVKLRIHPGLPGSGFVFENDVTMGAIPAPFIEPIEDGIREALGRGVLAGHPIDDVRVVLYDGSYHDVDSSPSAFRTAAEMAFQDGMRRSRPALLQPMVRLEVRTPREHLAEVMADLTGRGARVYGGDESGGSVRVTARAAVADTVGYGASLRRLTNGRASYTMRFDGYDPFEPTDDPGGDRSSGVRSPLRPASPPRASNIALPEPPDDDLII